MSVSNESLELGMENLVPTYHACVNTEYEELNFLAYKLTAIEITCNIVSPCLFPFYQVIRDNYMGKSIRHLNTLPSH